MQNSSNTYLIIHKYKGALYSLVTNVMCKHLSFYGRRHPSTTPKRGQSSSFDYGFDTTVNFRRFVDNVSSSHLIPQYYCVITDIVDLGQTWGGGRLSRSRNRNPENAGTRTTSINSIRILLDSTKFSSFFDVVI